MNKKTALIIIDMQNDFVLPGAPACVGGAQASIPKVKQLLDYFREKKLPVFHVVREYRSDGSDIEITRLDNFLNNKKCVVPGTPGCEIVDELKPIDGEYRIVKPRFSGFMNTELDYMLRRLGVDTIIVAGTQYPNCVRATIYDGVSYGYHVQLLTDAASAATPEVAEANITDIKNIGVECMTVDEYIEKS